MTVYSRRAPKTNMMQAITQHSIAVKPSAYKSNFNEILPSIIHRGIFYSKNFSRRIPDPDHQILF